MSSRNNDTASSSSSFDTATHGRLRTPRSLDGVEDAEVIWDTIARRFPNTAPLLCEMETVIERAEDLLRQLKAPWLPQENDTSGSFHTPDSRGSDATISMGSDIESFAEETDVTERHIERTDVENVGTNQAPYNVSETQQANLESDVEHYDEEERPDPEYRSSSSPGRDEVAEDSSANFGNECHGGTQGESDTNVTYNADKGFNASSEERLMAMVTEQNSLEGWAKIAEDAMRAWHDDVEAVEASTNSENEPEISVNRNPDSCSLTINNDSRSDGTDIHAADKSDDTKILTDSSSMSESSATIGRHRSPLTVLEEYAKRCEVSIKYKCRTKPNLCVVNGDLCGFRAMSCAGTQEEAKNGLATKVLWMVAEHQMDGSKLSSVCGLSDLSREEMLEAIGFNEGELKNASQRLYKFCLEMGESTPEYSIRYVRTNQGFMYAAHCVALDHVGVGQGLRKDSAKIAAAENLCQKYAQGMKPRM